MTTAEPGIAAPIARPSITLLIANLTGGHLAMTIALPSMPSVAVAFAVDAVTVQLTITLYIAMFAAAQLVAGPLSDRFGRRPVLVWGLALFTASSLACALAPDITTLIAARAAQGAGACVGMVVTRALIRDVYGATDTGRVLGYAAMAIGVAPAIAPVLGGYLEVWYGWRAAYWLTVAYSAVGLILTWWRLAETRPAGGAGPGLGPLRGYALLLRSRVFLAYVGVTAFGAAGYFAFISAAPLVYIGALGMAPDDFSVMIAFFSLGYVGGAFIVARLVPRLGIVRLIAVGSVLILVPTAGLVVLAFAGIAAPGAVMAVIFANGVCHGLVAPPALAGIVGVRPELSGTGAALAGCLQISFGAAVSMMMGALVYETQIPMAVVMMVMAVLGLGAARAVVTATR